MKKIITLLCIIPFQFIVTSCKDDDTKNSPTPITKEADSDNDGVIDSEDSDPNNPNKCKDSDNDGCDDCSITGADKSGGDPNNDGPDQDGDGICDSGEENKDTDNDGVLDSEDSDPENPNICRDVDKDGCDDCINTGANKSGGDPNNDGEDLDQDGICDENDPEIIVCLYGNQDTNITLNPKISYILKGPYHITNNAVLTIPEGTIITSEKGKHHYIAILKGSKINIKGTKDKPVIMKGQGSSGDWGGLIICGKAISTEGVDNSTRLGGIIYGGTDSEDNSGIINYLIIKDSGSEIDSATEFNGLTLYSVGSGTSINNVAILNGADDGIELYGGSVNVKNLYCYNNSDDSIDWNEGYNGIIENAYIKLDINFGFAIEGSGVKTKPLFKNITATSSNLGIGVAVTSFSACDFIGLTLNGFNPEKSFVSRKDGIISNSTVDGKTAIYNGIYNSSTTKEEDFSWVK